MQLTPQDKLTLCCIKLHPSNEELEQVNSLIPFVQDWGSLINNLIDRGIGPLFLNKLPQLSNSHLIPSEQKSKLQQAYYKTVGRSTILYEHFRKIAEAFALKNIPVIVLKGIYLSEWLYQDIGLRQFSDIDLLIKEADGLDCLSVLYSIGYQTIEDTRSEFIINNSEFVHYLPMVLNGVSIEIHIKLHRSTEKFQLNLAEFWYNAIQVTINHIPVFALNNQDLLIYLCIHLDKHFRGGHVQFTSFNDITNLLERVSDTFNWDEFSIVCQSYQCEEVVFKYIVIVNKYINARVPQCIIEKYNSLLKEKDEKLFIKYLSGFSYFGSSSAVSVHIKNLKNLNSFKDKLRYLWEDIFPQRAFMITTYNIKNPRLIVFYFLYRWWIGLKGIIKMVVNRNR